MEPLWIAVGPSRAASDPRQHRLPARSLVVDGRSRRSVPTAASRPNLLRSGHGEWATFWRIVEGARSVAGGDTERVAQVLLRRLRELAPDEIEGFQERWEQAEDELFRWPIHDAATLLLGPLDGDVIFAVQDWIVSHCRRTMQHMQDEPDNLVQLMPDRHNAHIDWFCGLAIEAHTAATGRP